MILDIILPRDCHVCGAALTREEHYICSSCAASLPRSLYHRIPMNPMEQRFAGLIRFERATGFLLYSRNSPLAELVHDFKYRKFRGLARTLGALAAKELLLTGFLSDIDGVLPVPMHFLKQARRGYNPAEEIARGLCKEIGIPLLGNLRASRPHRTQTSLTLEERRRNTSDLFRVRHPEELTDKHILILDDVCTTGSTLLACGEALLAAVPTARISFLTLAVT